MGNGVNFAVFSAHASGVELCLFDRVEAAEENVRIPVKQQTDQVWHVFLPDARPGQFYGFRVSGPYDPQRGLRFNNSKLLLDPYAKAVVGAVSWADEMFGYIIGSEKEDLSQDFRDDAWGVPKSVVIDSGFDWQNDKRPAIPMHESVIYELHVKGFSKRWGDLPEQLRGTYAGLGSPACHRLFQETRCNRGGTASVHAHTDDQFLVDQWPNELLGLQHYRLFCSPWRILQQRANGAVARVQDNGAQPPRRRNRGDSRRGLQSHRRRQSSWPDALVPGNRQPSYYRLNSGESTVLHDFTGHRQHA